MKRFSCGEVEFVSKRTHKFVNLMGDARVVALRQFYRYGKVKSAAIVPFVHGYGEVNRDQVRWDTCGDAVTRLNDTSVAPSAGSGPG